ncbi:MAG: hypothetical protein LBJ00_10935 [Planctomycetaceae bacterium]|jgi:hypothetical protein|nr:hypothetical protein [Planctomycetaceae bacterium]
MDIGDTRDKRPFAQHYQKNTQNVGATLAVTQLRYTQAVLKFPKLNTQAQQREVVVQGRSLSPYRLWYKVFPVPHAPNVLYVPFVP